MNDNINAQEVEILKEIPAEKRFDFIEKNGERMRSILEQHDQERIAEEIEDLKRGYISL